MRVLTTCELNRALLARQLLLERARARFPISRAVERLCALQAQYSPSPYVALWSRLEGFRKEQLTRALERRQVVKATLMRVTLHVVSGRDFPYFAAAWLPGARAGIPRVPREMVEKLARRVHEAASQRPHTHEELAQLVGDELGARWRVRSLVPLVHVPPSGTWRFHGRPQLVAMEPWLDTALPDARAGAERLARRYLAAFGPASRADLLRFAGLRAGDLAQGLDALEPLRRFRSEEGKELLDLRRAPLPAAGTPAPVRFLARWDAALLAHDDRTRILPRDLHATVFRKNADVLPTFLVDGLVAGTWSIERTKSKATLRLEPFAPLPPAHWRELVEEGERLVRFVEDGAASHAVR